MGSFDHLFVLLVDELRSPDGRSMPRPSSNTAFDRSQTPGENSIISLEWIGARRWSSSKAANGYTLCEMSLLLTHPHNILLQLVTIISNSCLLLASISILIDQPLLSVPQKLQMLQLNVLPVVA
jgi:hypothetical protein